METVDEPRPATWWDRNGKWVVTLGLLGSLAAVAAIVTLVTALLLVGLRSSPLFNEALAIARADPQVIRELGEPVVAGWLVRASFESTGESRAAEIRIPISGPLRSGTLFVAARKSAGGWRFEALEVRIAGRSGRIDLIQSRARSARDQV
jgi:hypothetical protein